MVPLDVRRLQACQPRVRVALHAERHHPRPTVAGSRPNAGSTARRLARLRANCPPMLTAFGVSALTFMMLMYALERRHAGYILAFACGCSLASLYGFLSGAWAFGIVEAIWAGVAIHRFANRNAVNP